MAEAPAVITLGKQKFIRTSDMAVKTLYIRSTAVGTLTMHDSLTNANYQVGAGKVFKLLEIQLFLTEVGAGAFNIYEADTADTADGSIRMVLENWAQTAGFVQGVVIDCDIDFAATKFPNWNDAGARDATVIFRGIEMDA
mgnify:CR=1 FL=1